MGSTLCFLAAGLHAIAAGLAFRLARSIRYRWGWVLIALAMGLQAVRRVSVGVELLATGGPMPTSEWLALLISLLFLVGTIALQGFFQESRQDADFRVTVAAREQAVQAIERLREQSEKATLERDASLRRARRRPGSSRLSWKRARCLDRDLGSGIAGPPVESQQRSASAGTVGRKSVGHPEFWEWLYPEASYRSKVLAELQESLQRGDAIRGRETRVRTKSGETRIISWSTTEPAGPGRGGCRVRGGGPGCHRSRRAAEESLKRVHAIQNLILEHNVLGLAFIQERRFVWSNPRAAEMFGIPLDRLLGSPSRIIYPDDASYEEIGRKSYPLMGEGKVADLRMRMRRSDGHFFWCRLVGMAVDPALPHAGSVWLAEDISKQVAAEEALKDSEARFRGAFEGTQDALLLLTPDGIFDCNQGALELFGFTHKAEVLRMQPTDFSPAQQPGGEDSRSLATRHLQAAIRDGSARFRWEYRRQNGETFPAEVLLSTFKMGRNRVIQACVRDIRERLAAEAAVRDSEARFRLFFERFADPLLMLDGRSHAFLGCNQAALDALRCTREEMGQLTPLDLLPEFQPDGRSSRESGLAMLSLAFEHGSHRFPWVHRSPRRGDFAVEVLLTVIRPEGNPLIIAAWRERPPA